MSANIDKTIPAVYDARDGQAWHKFGLPMDAEGLDLGLSIKKAIHELSPGLATKIYKAPVMVQCSDGYQQLHPVACAIVREYDQKVLPGTPGHNSFGLPQPRQHLVELYKALRASCGEDALNNMRLSYIGFLDGGRRFIASINLGDVEINGEAHTRYLNLTFGIDGCQSRELMYSVVRQVCMNTVAASRRDATAFKEATDVRGYAKIKNTKHADSRFHDASIDVADMHAEFKGLKERLESYAQTKVTKEQVGEIFELVARKAGLNVKSKRTQNRVRDWVRIYLESGWAGTLNGVHQALTDRNALTEQVRPGDREPAEAYLNSQLFGSNARFMETADEVLRGYVNVESRVTPEDVGIAIND